MGYAETIGGTRYVFNDVTTLLARATPRRSGDLLAGIGAADATERVAAQRARRAAGARTGREPGGAL